MLYEFITCQSCQGPMRDCEECLATDIDKFFPLRCGGVCPHMHGKVQSSKDAPVSPESLFAVPAPDTAPTSLKEAVWMYEAEIMARAMRYANGNQTLAAELLNTTRRQVGWRLGRSARGGDQLWHSTQTNS